MKKNKSFKLTAALLLGASAITIASPAHAQDADKVVSDIVRALLGSSNSTPEPNSEQDARRFMEAFNNSKYNYCDAKLLGVAWGVSPSDGKIAIGRKLTTGAAALIPGELQSGRRMGGSCDFTDTGHSYEDAVSLGNVWGVSPWEAKSKASTYYTNGQSDIVKEVLANSANIEARNNARDDFRFMEAFNNSKYNYCDAKLLGVAWGVSPSDGKIAIGRKLTTGAAALIPGELQSGRRMGGSCDFTDTGHSYEDAVSLGNVWGVSPWEAKSKASTYYTNGQSDIVKEVLASASISSPTDIKPETRVIDQFEGLGDVLVPPGTDLVRGMSYWSSSRAHYLMFQTDNNVVIYTAAGQPVWATQMLGFNYQEVGIGRVKVQEDGNFAFYTDDNRYIWSALNRSQPAGTSLHLGDDGVLRIVRPDGDVIWNSHGNSKPEITAFTEKTANGMLGRWVCEDTGDVEVTVFRNADGTNTIKYKSMSEMAMNEPAIVTNLETSRRTNRMTDANGTVTVTILSNGSLDVKEGFGSDAISYSCYR